MGISQNNTDFKKYSDSVFCEICKKANSIEQIYGNFQYIKDDDCYYLSDSSNKNIEISLDTIPSSIQYLGFHYDGHIKIVNLDGICFFYNLKIFDYSHNIDSIPSCLAELNNLVEVELIRSRFYKYPQGLRGHNNLRILNLGKLESFPDEMDLPNLQYFRCYSPSLRSLPNCLYKLSKLQALTLVSDSLITVSDDLKKLQNLQFLTLNIEIFDTNTINILSGLTSLKGINVTGNNPKQEIVLRLKELDFVENIYIYTKYGEALTKFIRAVNFEHVQIHIVNING